MAWRLIYGNDKVFNLSECGVGEKIYTNQTLFTGATIYSCFDKIDEQSLYAAYPTGDTQVIVFSSGTREIMEMEVFLSGLT